MVSIMKMNRKPVAMLEKVMRYSAISGASSALLILLICFAFAGPIFADDDSDNSNMCQAASSLSVLIRGKNVTAYVPNGAWGLPTPNINVVPIEGDNVSGRVPLIPTRQPVNSCASNSKTGQTICTANNLDPGRAAAGENDVYLISGTTIKQLKSAATGTAMFNEGNCTNCGVAIDPVHNRAVIGLALNSGTFPWVTGFQVLDLGNLAKPGMTVPSQAPNLDGTGQQISAGFLIDPAHNLILSPNQHGTYEIIKLGKADVENDDGQEKDNNNNNAKNNNIPVQPTPTFTENSKGIQVFGAAGADCKGGTILATIPDFSNNVSQVLIGDLDNGKTKSGSPAVTFRPPFVLTQSNLSFGANGIAVDQDTRTGIITGEFGFLNPGVGGNITAFQLSKNSDDERPRISDWVTCSLDQGFNVGLTPHSVTSYHSPKGDDAMAVVTDFDISQGAVKRIAVINLSKMLDKKTVSRAPGGHACDQGTLPSNSARDRDPVARIINLQ